MPACINTLVFLPACSPVRPWLERAADHVHLVCRAGNTEGITLSGWIALAGMSAMVVLVAYAGLALMRRLRGGSAAERDFTLVLKQKGAPPQAA